MPQITPLPGILEGMLDWDHCKDAAEQPSTVISTYTECLERLQTLTNEAFDQGHPIEELIAARSAVVDRILVLAWKHFGLDSEEAALIAVGGYGRGELHPGSDIDILLLFANEPEEAACNAISGFLTFLWDIKFHVGHSVRTLLECEREARDDITVATNLMEARLLAGNKKLCQTMKHNTGPDHIWPSPEFFSAKLKEQQNRHQRFNDTAYNVEPNVKEGPGGLRDIQMIGWVTKRHFGAHSLQELVKHGFLEEEEYKDLIEGQSFLWRVRYALHRIAGRREERLLFDFQKPLALMLGYEDGPNNMAVEQFMQHYYRTIMELERLNEMLLQLYDEALLQKDREEEIIAVNKRFQIHNNYIEIIDKQLFVKYPPALLEIFLVLQVETQVRGVRASTIRSIRRHRHLIDDRFRRDIRCRSLFMEILRQPKGITEQLRRMNRYGLLAAYLPSFGLIVGRMQYDLFHVYTVDEHILMVLRNVRRASISEYEHENPLSNRVFKELPKPELLYLAALFHDIAKGRQGDHSQLGAVEAEQFCLDHGLSSHDAKLVAWLVLNHLVMSMTAQQRDISDPDVVYEFAKLVGNKTRLDYLYLLTVADIRGTNPEIWNSWKASLLTSLYQQTKQVLRRGLDNPAEHQELVVQTQHKAEELLLARGLQKDVIHQHWNDFEDDYFLRYSAESIARHTQLITQTPISKLPLVEIQYVKKRGSTEIFIYQRDSIELFFHITRTLELLGLNILDARIMSTRSGMAIDTLQVLDHMGNPLIESDRLKRLKDHLCRDLMSPEEVSGQARGELSRQHRHFEVPTRINFYNNDLPGMTTMELRTGDRPGLLSRVAEVLMAQHIRLHTARIATIGEQADDVLYITDNLDQPLTSEATDELHKALTDVLEEPQ